LSFFQNLRGIARIPGLLIIRVVLL